jgi:hypothetical protein
VGLFQSTASSFRRLTPTSSCQLTDTSQKPVQNCRESRLLQAFPAMCGYRNPAGSGEGLRICPGPFRTRRASRRVHSLADVGDDLPKNVQICQENPQPQGFPSKQGVRFRQAQTSKKRCSLRTHSWANRPVSSPRNALREKMTWGSKDVKAPISQGYAHRTR